MKRTVITALFALSLLAGFACTGGGELSKRQAKKVKEYFSHVLQGTAGDYSNGKSVKIDDIAQMRAAVWGCWRDAVMAHAEEKLIAPFAAEEPRDTGYWHLPEALEPEADRKSVV